MARPGPRPRPPPGGATEMSAAAIEAMIAERVAAALVQYDNSRSSGGENGRNGGNPKPCSYKDFMSCKPHNFSGSGGVIELTRWFEKTESVFQISNCTTDCQVKFAACTFMHSALSWWNSHVQTVGVAEANRMTWDDLKEKMVEEYCPRTELQNLEQDVTSVTFRQ